MFEARCGQDALGVNGPFEVGSIDGASGRAGGG
jgi:hypothetical protein